MKFHSIIAEKKYKLVIELHKTKKCLISDAYSLQELMQKSMMDLSVDMDALAYDVSVEDNREHSAKVEIEHTGYEDSLNTEIYDGDIFDWANHSRGVVNIIKGQWCFSNLSGDFSIHGYCKDGKVVGNTFTHSRLFEHEDLVTNINKEESANDFFEMILERKNNENASSDVQN